MYSFMNSIRCSGYYLFRFMTSLCAPDSFTYKHTHICERKKKHIGMWLNINSLMFLCTKMYICGLRVWEMTMPCFYTKNGLWAFV